MGLHPRPAKSKILYEALFPHPRVRLDLLPGRSVKGPFSWKDRARTARRDNPAKVLRQPPVCKVESSLQRDGAAARIAKKGLVLRVDATRA